MTMNNAPKDKPITVKRTCTCGAVFKALREEDTLCGPCAVSEMFYFILNRPVKLVSVTLVETEIEPGWPLTREDAPLGKEYVVDVERTAQMTIMERHTGRSKSLPCVWVVEPAPAGWLPMMAFGMKP
jgi:hypothetical protein